MTNTPTRPYTGQGSIFRMLRGSLRYLRPYWIEYSVAMIAIILVQIFSVTFTVSPKLLVDEAIIPQDWGKFTDIVAILGGLFLVSTLFTIAADYLIGRAEDELKKDLRLEMFTALQYIPVRFFTQAQPGEVVALFASELLTFQDALRTLLPNAFSALIQLGLAVIALVALDWRLSIAVGISVPIVILIPRKVIDWAAEADFHSQARDAHAAFAVQDNVQAEAIIRAFGLQRSEIDRFKSEIGRDEKRQVHGWGAIWSELRDEFKAGVKRSYFLKRLVGTLTNLQNMLLNSVVILVGGYMAFHGQLTVATLLTFIPLLDKAGLAVNQLAAFFKDLISASNGFGRLELFTQQAVPQAETQPTLVLSSLKKEISLEGLKFSYHPEHMVLDGITCTIPAGGLTALVGRSGAGKSTLLELLIRFYDPQQGRILYDGLDLQQVSYDSLHQQVGVVLQDPALLNTSIRANIALAKPDATQQEIETGAKSAGIHEDILNLAQGYATVVGEGGRRLSPGMRKRIAIARALLRKPSLLILDEPTAALDPETETNVLKTIQALADQRTILMVTHRLAATADFARKIVVMDHGKVVESGQPAELLKKGGLYAHLWKAQTGFAVSQDGRIAEITPQRLRAIELFKDMADATLDQVASQFVVSYFEADQVIFREGEPGQRFYILVRGKVSIRAVGYREQELELNILEDGDYFGEIALLQDSPRSATVKTLLPTLLLSLERSQFLKLVEDHSDVREQMKDIVTRRNLRQVLYQGRGPSKLSILDNLIDD